MRKNLFSLSFFFATTVALAQEPCTIPAPGSCPPVGDPIISTCFADMEKILARSMEMANVSKLNGHNFWPDGSGGTFNCNDPVATKNFTGYPADIQCDIGGYSPTRYCEDINLAANLNATLLMNVATSWGEIHSKFNPGSGHLASAAKAVVDINALYDCAGHRRPVIGCGITENVDHSVDNLAIPNYVVEAFSETINANPDLASYYAVPRNFNFSNICIGTDDHPNISKLEARMLFYYIATQYIDRGYKEITPDYISYSVLHHGSDPTGYYVYDLLTKVRNYAASKNSMLIIPSYLPGVNFYYGTTLLYDFRYSAVRPQEITVPAGAPFGVACTKTMVDDQNEAAFWQSSGTAPYSNCYYGDPTADPEYRMPFLTGFDWHEGTCNGGPFLRMSQYDGPSERHCVWGYDEARFFNSLSATCQTDYVDYIYETMRSISHRGFFCMPARLICKNGSFPLNPAVTDPSSNGAYRMANNSSLVNRIANDIWHVHQVPSFTLQPIGCVGGQNAYLATVNTPEQSTVYTWHVKNRNGTWQPYTYGRSRIIFPTTGTGIYEVGLRCDNWGYTTSPIGVLTSQQNPVLFQYSSCRMGNEENSEDKKAVAQLEAKINNANDITEVYEILKQYNIDTSSKSLSLSYLENNGSIKDIQVYPNPANDKVTISIPKEYGTDLNITIYNSMGQLMTAIHAIADNNTTDVDVSFLTSGVYTLRIKTDKTIYTQNITVVR